jgi:hypothetical protein
VGRRYRRKEGFLCDQNAVSLEERSKRRGKKRVNLKSFVSCLYVYSKHKAPSIFWAKLLQQSHNNRRILFLHLIRKCLSDRARLGSAILRGH